MPELVDFSNVRAAASAVQAELNRRRWLEDPVSWVAERLGDDLWSKQRDIMEAVRDHRLVAVRSAHGIGKSAVAARIACWWGDCHPPGTWAVVTTATTRHQVEAVLWKELRRAHAKGGLRGRTNRIQWLEPMVNDSSKEEMPAFGLRPSDEDPTAFHGVHNEFVLVIFDEADGVAESIWEAADSLLINEDSRFLVIGNPINPASKFAKVSKPDSGWFSIRISAFDSPNFTGEPISPTIAKQLVSKVWVGEKELHWGKNNPLYISRVLGEFPDVAEDGLIPPSWVQAAQVRWETTKRSHPIEFGVDVGAGGDKNVIVCREGNVAEVIADDMQPDTMKTAGKIKQFMASRNPDRVKIDYIGIGRGAVDRLKEQKLNVEGIQVGMSAHEHGFRNLRAEGYWHLREMFRPNKLEGEPMIAIDPKDEDLAAQLMALRYETTSDGKIQIESKEAMRRRHIRSPDRADALMLAFLPQPKRRKGATWGKRRGGQSQAQFPSPTTYTRR